MTEHERDEAEKVLGKFLAEQAINELGEKVTELGVGYKHDRFPTSRSFSPNLMQPVTDSTETQYQYKPQMFQYGAIALYYPRPSIQTILRADYIDVESNNITENSDE